MCWAVGSGPAHALRPWLSVDDLVQARIPVQHFFANAATVLMLRKDARLRRIVQSCRVVNADGQSVVWASKALGRPLPERVAGPDLLDALLTLAETRRYRTYFLGARQDVIESLVARLRHDTSASHSGRLSEWILALQRK